MVELLATFARRQLADVDALVTPMLDRVAEQMPMVVDLTPELRLEMTQWLRRLTTAGLQIVADDESLDELGPMIEQMARRRRTQGVDLWQTLKAYEVTQQALLDSVSRNLNGHPLKGSLFPQLTSRLLEFQRVTTTWVTAGYTGAAEPRGRDRDREAQTLLEIRAGRRPADAANEDQARRLEFSLPLREITVSVPLGAGGEDAVRAAARANPWGVVGLLAGRVVTLTLRGPHAFPDPSGAARVPETLEPAAVDAAITAAGQAADVAAALGVARYTAAEAAPLAALLAVPEPERGAFVQGCFGTLPQTARGRSLLSSVAAALTYSRPGEAARALHVHRHTLDYRLGRFTAETGLDLADPATRFRCSIGLFLIGLLPHRPEPAG